MIMTDSAFPPSPTQLLIDMNSVGAECCAIYTYGPFTNYTRAHVDELRGSGKYVLPIIVPGNMPGPYLDVLGTTRLYGINSGPLVVDLEPGSEPSPSWVSSFYQAAQEQGFRVERYGTKSILGLYPGADGDWIANWIRTGIMNPIPTLPQGWLAWQFVNDVHINNNVYDVSVIDSQFILGDVWKMDYSLKLCLVGLMYFAVLGRGPNSQPEADQWAKQIGDQGENCWQILEDIAASDEARAYETPASHISAIQKTLQTLSTNPNHEHPFTLSGLTGQAQ